MLSKLKYALIAGSGASLLLIAGCSTSSQTQYLPQGGLTMEQVVKNQDGDIAPNNQDLMGSGIPLTQSGVNTDDYTRTALNETSNLFKPLPNPTLVGYVYPHVVGQGDNTTLVPGYSVPYSMYTTAQYAIPTQ